MIQSLSQRQDHDNFLPACTAMLGIRGHMYGELIRIQVMLAKDDPEMEVIDFTVSFLLLPEILHQFPCV